LPYFLECSGNGASSYRDIRPELSPPRIDGRTSTSEWTGVPLATLLREVGVRPAAKWFLAEGQDAAVMTRSIPIEKAWDDALIAYGQNGDALRPEQGYPARLFLPGWEGNANVKWIRRIEVADRPFMTREETSKYTDPLADGTARMFSFVMDAQSIITSPAYPGAAPQSTRARHLLPLQSHPSVAGAVGRRCRLRTGRVIMRAMAAACALALVGSACGRRETGEVRGGAPKPYGFGRPAAADEVRAWDIDMMPDGSGLPAGSGTASRGALLYQRKCAACHGKTGTEGPFDPLVARERRPDFPFGRDPTLVKAIGNYWPYATTLYDYINRAMPLDAPGSLKPDEV